MVELKTAEHVIHFMNSGQIKLSRYDEKFISSLSTITQVTTNQVELFYKLIYKYARQLAKHELDPEVLINLPWVMKVIESSPDYTHGHIETNGDEITFKCPFNRNFINEFRKQEFNTFVWNRERRLYESKFGSHSLQLLLNIGSKYYKDIHLCANTQRIIDSLHPYSSCTNWDPTLKLINGNLMIASINEVLYELIKDIPLVADTHTLAKIAGYGINVSPEVYGDNQELRFAASMEFTHEVSDVINIIPWLKNLGCDMVYVTGGAALTPYRAVLFKGLKEANMPHFEVNGFHKPPTVSEHNFPVLIKLRPSFDMGHEPYKVSKVIRLRNSEPIDIK